ncbi:class I SAM-dependent methyltransferase [Maridesulfovibrio bastinii]|uniref:class I SAM-dependent methyltransferase n=1 Tax=Maridesulfovibrio bastinii TaxID=47157 RepID=UPI0004013FB7|nr:class I SAM-dependent methyltransferase [Maridesulfovibrio bastinii]
MNLTPSKKKRKKIKKITSVLSVYEKRQWKRILDSENRNVRILEVGCGRCSKTVLLKKFGFHNILGVEKNLNLVNMAVSEGFNVVDVDSFEREFKDEQFDLLILSHIIEHFDFKDLIEFMSGYLKHLKPGGRLLIATPVLHEHFWLDLDHVKPYYPHGIKNFFGSDDEQVQLRLPYKLKLIDIRFRRGPYKVKLSRALLLKKNDLPMLLINLMSAFFFKISCGLLGHKTGWIGLYKVY